MLTILVGDPGLEPDEVVEAVRYKVLTSVEPEEVLFDSDYLEDHLTSYTYTGKLDLDKDYWTVTQIKKNTGISAPSEPSKVSIEDYNQARVDNDYPTLITQPDPVIIFDVREHPSKFFNIRGTEFKVVGNSQLDKVEILVTDFNGKAVTRFMNRTAHFDMVFDMELNKNSLYNIHMIYHGTSYDSSTPVSYTIYTSHDDRVKIYGDGGTLTDRSIYIEEVYGFQELEWMIYDTNSKLLSGTSDTTEISIDTLPENNGYLNIGIRIKVAEEWGELTWFTKLNSEVIEEQYGFPYRLPFRLGTGDTEA